MAKSPTLLEKIVYFVLFIAGVYLCFSWTHSRLATLFGAILLLLALSIVAGVVQKLRGGTFLPASLAPPPPQPDGEQQWFNQYTKRWRDAQASGRCPFCDKPLVVSIDSKGKPSKPECPECKAKVRRRSPV